MPPPKQHTFKYTLPPLDSYKPSEVPADFWEHWWKRPLDLAIKENDSWIGAEKLKEAYLSRGLLFGGKVAKVCKVLRDGADLGALVGADCPLGPQMASLCGSLTLVLS